MEIASPWQHPSFLGSHLPIESEIDEDGFWAKWELSHFAHLRPSSWLSFVETPSWLTEHAASDAVLIRLVTPVDHYLMSERSVKYGLLFVILVSCVLFVFETLADIRIHPVQYTMVAAALCLFFLLLVSLSEIIGFAGGYLIASTMTTPLLAFYIATIARVSNAAAFLPACSARSTAICSSPWCPRITPCCSAHCCCSSPSA